MNKQEIETIRKQLGLSQRQFAEKLGVSQKTVWSWESGRSEPSAEYLERLTTLQGKQVVKGSQGSQNLEAGSQKEVVKVVKFDTKGSQEGSQNSEKVVKNDGEVVREGSQKSGEVVREVVKNETGSQKEVVKVVKFDTKGSQEGSQNSEKVVKNDGEVVREGSQKSGEVVREVVKNETGDSSCEKVTDEGDTSEQNVTGIQNVTADISQKADTLASQDDEVASQNASQEPGAISKYYETMYKDADGYISLCTITQPKDNTEGILNVEGFYGISQMSNLLAEANKSNGQVHIYAGIHPLKERPKNGRGKETDILGVAFFAADVDAKDFIDDPTERQKAIKEKGLYQWTEELLSECKAKALAHIHAVCNKVSVPPSAIIGSGHGFYPIFKFDKFIKFSNNQHRDELKQVNKAFHEAFAADSTFDFARILRVPGTRNIKPGYPADCKLIEFHPDRRYTLDDLKKFKVEATPKPQKEKHAEGLLTHNTASAPAKAQTVSLSDEELIEKAKDAKNGNGAKFTALWQGDITGYESHSEADLALCSLLAFWTGKDSDRIDKLFRQSGLYREKWDREDYRGLTIDTAIESVTAVYEPTEPKTVTKQAASKEKEDEPSAGEIALKFLHTYFIADGIYILRYYREDWSEWNGKCYRELSTQDLRARIARFVDDETKRKVSKSFVASVIEALTGRCLVPADAVQPVWVGNRFQAKKAGHVLAFENGWLNFDAFLKGEGAEVKPHMPALFTQVALPYDFDPNAECPKWQEFLDHNMERDADRIAILQEFTGYCFTWDTTLHKFLLMEGEAGTGKSTFTDVINALLGESNVSHVPLEAFGQRFSLYPTLGKIANIASEIGELDSVAEGQLKAFVAGDPMQFERKYRDTVQAKPTARLILATNNRPRFVDRTDGIWRRLILVPWNVVVSDEKRIYGLGEQIIREDLAGVFNWAIAGLKRLREQGRFTESEIVQVAINEYKLESNPAKAFLRENYDEGNGEAKVHEVYNNYKDFCEECGYRPLNMSNFGREVRRLFPHIMKVRRQNNGLRYQVYAGIFEV